MSVTIGAVETWDTGCMVREQALKVLEEAAEVLASTECTDYLEMFGKATAECADVITATCNLLAMLGVEDARGIVAECARRQRERGRL